MIVLTGGKTGGHIMPLLALAHRIPRVTYVGATKSLEERLCQQEQIPFYALKLKNNHILPILKAACSIHLPHVDAIISTGGYVSVPMLLYGIWNNIPIYLLEENVVIGRTNKWISFFAKRVFLAYPLKKMKKKYEVVGIPLLDRKSEVLQKNFDILIIGGSLGSKPLCQLAEQLSKIYDVCLIAGRYAKEVHLNKGCVLEYSDQIISLMKSSRLIISRAGASTTYEIFTNQVPALIIPSKHTKMNHQYLNALYFEEKKVARMVKEETPFDETMELIEKLLSDDQIRHNMIENQKKLVRLDSTEKILKRIEEDLK